MPLAPLLQRIWELRENLTAYDAAYVTLAERIDGPLVTCDGKLVRPPDSLHLRLDHLISFASGSSSETLWRW